MPLILQKKDFPQTALLFQGLRYSCSLTSAYPDVFFLPLRFRVSRPKLGRSNLTNQCFSGMRLPEGLKALAWAWPNAVNLSNTLNVLVFLI